MLNLRNTLLENDPLGLHELLDKNGTLEKCLFHFAQDGQIELFKYMVKQCPDLLKVKLHINEREVSVFVQCITLGHYELIEFLLEYNADENEDSQILMMAFCIELNEDIIELLMTKSTAYKNILMNFSSNFLDLCLESCNQNANIVLKYMEPISIKNYIKYATMLNNPLYVYLTLDKLHALNLLPNTESLLIYSVINMQFVQIYEKYIDFEEYKDKRLYYAFLYGNLDVLEHVYNTGNFSSICLDEYVKTIINEQEEEEYLAKFSFLMRKGCTVNNIDSVKSLQLRRILTNNKEYVITSTIQVECAICSDDINVGDTVVKLPCKHQFHEDCFNSWKVNCPTCRWGN